MHKIQGRVSRCWIHCTNSVKYWYILASLSIVMSTNQFNLSLPIVLEYFDLMIPILERTLLAFADVSINVGVRKALGCEIIRLYTGSLLLLVEYLKSSNWFLLNEYWILNSCLQFFVTQLIEHAWGWLNFIFRKFTYFRASNLHPIIRASWELWKASKLVTMLDQ